MERNYLAFISYRHVRPDTNVSGYLRKMLEGWHLPKSCTLPKKRRVFRDTDELPTSTDLGADIENALEHSDCLIAVCSEEYVTSKWCMREIDRYIEMGRKDRIFPILISGTEATSIPAQLKGIKPVMDLRGADGSLRRKVYDGIPHMLELLSGTGEKELAVSERRFRSMTRIAAFAGAAAIILGLILYTSGTANRIEQNNRDIMSATEEAQTAEQEAIAQRDEAFLKHASLLAKKAWIAMDEGDDIAALRYSLEALPDDLSSDLPVSAEAVNALRSALVMPDRQRNAYHYSDTVQTGPEEADFLINDIGTPEGDPNSKWNKEDSGPEESLPDYLTINDEDSAWVISEVLAYEGNPVSVSSIMNSTSDDFREGYTHVLPDDAVYYGGGSQLVINSWPDPIWCVLDGEPFLAEKAWGFSKSGGFFAGWDGRTLAVYHFDTHSEDGEEQEASLSVPLEEEPRYLLFSNDGQELALIDPDGVLTLYHTVYGRIVQQPEGTYRSVLYPSADYQLFTLSEDGTIQLLDSITGTVLAECATPSPAKTMSYCETRDQLLILCEDCAAILQADNGELLYTLSLEEPAVSAVWEGDSGNRFRVIYEDHRDTYELDAAQQMNAGIYVSLSAPEAVSYSYHAEYSPEGDAVYLESYSGNLSKWDARTGELLWVNRNGSKDVSRRVSCPLSADSNALWRQYYDYYDINIQKIDAQTGELLYTTDWGASDLDGSRILELPDRHLGLVMGMYYDEPLYLFDTQTGELLWKKGIRGYAAFSEDGTAVICLDAENKDGLTYSDWSLKDLKEHNGVHHKEDFLRQELYLVYRVLSVENGETLEEKVLMKLGRGIEGRVAPVDGKYLVQVEDRWEVDLLTGEVTSYDPETAVTETVPTCTFAGQEAYIETEDDDTRLVSVSDGTILADAGKHRIAAAPDGQSLVIYYGDFTSLIVWPSDTQTLVQAAEEQLAAQERR